MALSHSEFFSLDGEDYEREHDAWNRARLKRFENTSSSVKESKLSHCDFYNLEGDEYEAAHDEWNKSRLSRFDYDSHSDGDEFEKNESEKSMRNVCIYVLGPTNLEDSKITTSTLSPFFGKLFRLDPRSALVESK